MAFLELAYILSAVFRTEICEDCVGTTTSDQIINKGHKAPENVLFQDFRDLF